MRKLIAQDLGHHQGILEGKRTSRLFYTSLQGSGLDLRFLILGNCTLSNISIYPGTNCGTAAAHDLLGGGLAPVSINAVLQSYNGQVAYFGREGTVKKDILKVTRVSSKATCVSIEDGPAYLKHGMVQSMSLPVLQLLGSCLNLLLRRACSQR